MLKNLRDYWTIKKSGLFDPVYYLTNYPDVRRANIDPVMHYIQYGWKEGRNPSADFITNFYINSYQDVKKAKINPLWHYIYYGNKEGRLTNPSNIPINLNNSLYININKFVFDLITRFHYLLLHLYNIPLLLFIKKLINNNHANFIINDYDNYRNRDRQRNIENLLSFLSNNDNIKNINYIFFLPLFSVGGAEIVAMNFIRLIIEKNPDAYILLIITDRDIMEINFSLPERLIILNLEQFLGSSDLLSKKIFIYDLINILRPSILHNINSSAFWELLIDKGDHLKSISKIFANIFSIQYDNNGRREGYAEYYLKKGLPFLSALISDNQRFFEEAVEIYNLQNNRQKMFTIYTPLSEVKGLVDMNKNIDYINNNKDSENKFNNNLNNKMQGIWAGRLDKEKRWYLFVDIVKNCSFCDFDVFGKSVVDDIFTEIPNLPNLNFKGPFSSFNEIFSTKKYDAFIFTSAYEGLPNTLLNVGFYKIPIIAPSVGGISELIKSNTGYLLSENPSVDEYIDALKEIRKNPNEAQKRAENLKALILERHCWDNFSNAVSKLPGYLQIERQNHL